MMRTAHDPLPKRRHDPAAFRDPEPFHIENFRPLIRSDQAKTLEEWRERVKLRIHGPNNTIKV